MMKHRGSVMKLSHTLMVEGSYMASVLALTGNKGP